jgi:outer membrane receptor protein involved in Fe transport
MNGRLDLEAMSFLMNFDNLVLAQNISGLPSLTNGGKQRFKGIDFTVGYQFQGNLYARGTYGWHDARFTDYLTAFDGVPAQIAGHRLEMSPHHLASAAIVHSPPRGIVASAQINVAGSRYLNKRNTAAAGAYATFGAGAGYRFERWELRLDGQNLNDTRPPVSESELGNAQYYRLTPRRLEARAILRF